LRKTSAPSLDLIPSGPIPPNPAELLMGERMEELINELKLRYDYIVIDTPPVGLVSDAFNLMRFSHANLYVVRHKYTPAERIKVLNKLYREGKIGKLGFVFNDMARKTRGYGYGYGGYGYGTNYGYGYYDEIDDKKVWWKRLISELTGR
jgi:Mrp family chromosome partitioning ATPase